MDVELQSKIYFSKLINFVNKLNSKNYQNHFHKFYKLNKQEFNLKKSIHQFQRILGNHLKFHRLFLIFLKKKFLFLLGVSNLLVQSKYSRLGFSFPKYDNFL